jgi:hypothetical protein
LKLSKTLSVFNLSNLIGIRVGVADGTTMVGVSTCSAVGTMAGCVVVGAEAGVDNT